MKTVMKHFFVSLLVLASIALNAQDNGGFVIDKIIGKVDNYIVLKSELDKAYQEYISNGGRPGEEARCQYLALLLRNKLMMAKAEIDSVIVPDQDVDAETGRRMNIILAQYGGSQQELEQKFNKTFEQFRLELRDQIREQMIINEMQRRITKDISITPAEVRRFFNRIPKDSLPFFSAEVEVAQIVRLAKVSNAQKEITKQKLAELRNRLLAGEDFGKLAREYSDDPSVTANNGDMGYVGRGMMVPEYEAMCFKLKPGEISMPVETAYGFHIIQLLDRRGNEYHSRHILISPVPSKDDLAAAQHFLDSLRNLILLDSITFQKAAREYSDDINTKGNGGFFTDREGALRVPVDELDPGVYFAIDTMKTGTISRPLVYRTDDGKDAVRILYYKNRIPPHLADLQKDWERIRAAALNEKQLKALEKWFDRARKDVYISIDPAYNYCGILDN